MSATTGAAPGTGVPVTSSRIACFAAGSGGLVSGQGSRAGPDGLDLAGVVVGPGDLTVQAPAIHARANSANRTGLRIQHLAIDRQGVPHPSPFQRCL